MPYTVVPSRTALRQRDVPVRERERPRARTRSGPTRRSKAARTPPATVTPSWWTRRPARCTSCTTPATTRAGSTAGSGAIWNLRSNALRPAGWTSADAAGLPILPGLVRYDEVESGSITHAIRMTAETTDTSYLWPARHEAGARSDPNLPPMGARFRLKASFDISGFSPQAQVVLRAMQQYGLIVADNGSNWYFGGTADPVVAAFARRRAETGAGERLRSGRRVLAHGEPRLGPGARAFPGPVTGMAAPPSGSGYWLTDAEGAVSAHNVPDYGSMAGTPLNAPINHIVSTPDGRGYWLVAADGGTFAFGDAGFYGSMGGKRAQRPGGEHRADAGRRRLLARGERRRRVLVRRRALLRFDGRQTPERADRGHRGRTQDRRILAGRRPTAASSPSTLLSSVRPAALRLQQPINGMAPAGGGNGYWLVAVRRRDLRLWSRSLLG